MLRKWTSIMVAFLLLLSVPFANAESVNEMTADELEAYISYLQVVLQQKRKAEAGAEVEGAIAEETELPIQNEASITVTFNDKQYVGTYSGDQQNGKPHGTGHFEGYHEGNRLIYDGQWEQGEMKGKGTAEAEVYTIHFDTREGVFNKTGPYEGEVMDGVPNGQGTFSTVNSQGFPWHYAGEWKNGQFNGQGKQWWESEDQSVYQGTFVNGEYAPTWSECLSLFAEADAFSIYNASISAIKAYDKCFSLQQREGQPPSTWVNYQFELAKFKKNPEAYCNKFVKVSGLRVVQVFSYQVGNYDVEEMILETQDGSEVYRGYHLGKTNIVENMRVEAYVLPLDWATYKNVSDESIWAMFCVISNYIYESYETLQRGDSGDDVLQMKFRMQELGYFSANAAFSDSFNSTCVERVKQFQEVNGLPVTGIADHDTLSLLYSDNAKPKN